MSKYLSISDFGSRLEETGDNQNLFVSDDALLTEIRLDLQSRYLTLTKGGIDVQKAIHSETILTLGRFRSRFSCHLVPVVERFPVFIPLFVFVERTCVGHLVSDARAFFVFENVRGNQRMTSCLGLWTGERRAISEQDSIKRSAR